MAISSLQMFDDQASVRILPADTTDATNRKTDSCSDVYLLYALTLPIVAVLVGFFSEL